jgi:hypothetical protein
MGDVPSKEDFAKLSFLSASSRCAADFVIFLSLLFSQEGL